MWDLAYCKLKIYLELIIMAHIRMSLPLFGERLLGKYCYIYKKARYMYGHGIQKNAGSIGLLGLQNVMMFYPADFDRNSEHTDTL